MLREETLFCGGRREAGGGSFRSRERGGVFGGREMGAGKTAGGETAGLF